MNIGLFKLVTGEEIVTRYTELNETQYSIDSPRILMLVQTGPAEMGIRMAPWIVGDVDGNFILNKDKIVVYSQSVPKQLEDGYIQQTSGLTLASSLK
jgi:hypothetical protein